MNYAGLLKLIEGDKQAASIRAAALMQLAELEIHHNRTSAADALIDQAEAAASELTAQDGWICCTSGPSTPYLFTSSI